MKKEITVANAIEIIRERQAVSQMSTFQLARHVMSQPLPTPTVAELRDRLRQILR